jgi:ABC-2 type transport system ATP-binding protein
LITIKIIRRSNAIFWGIVMIEVSGLTKRYGNVMALSNVSFTVPKGKIVGFLGANGAGKTTTMDIISGCSGADDGTTVIGGVDTMKEPERAKALLGYLPDEPPVYNDMRVVDFIEYAARLRKVPSNEIHRRVADTVDKLSLGEVQSRLVGNLSKGFRQRVGLAQAIVHSPPVLILDEPTEGLDPNQIVQIRDLIKSLAGEHTILLSSHILSEVQNTCEQIIIIHQGKIVQTGTYEEIVRRAEPKRLYYINVGRNIEQLVAKLSQVQGVSSAVVTDVEQQRAEFVVELPEQIDLVAKLAVEGGYGIRELAAARKSLEEIFIKLTH